MTSKFNIQIKSYEIRYKVVTLREEHIESKVYIAEGVNLPVTVVNQSQKVLVRTTGLPTAFYL